MTTFQKVIAVLLVATVVLLGVIVFTVTRSDEPSFQEKLACAIEADARGVPMTEVCGYGP